MPDVKCLASTWLNEDRRPEFAVNGIGLSVRIECACSMDAVEMCAACQAHFAPLYICVRGRGWHGRTLTWVINEPCNR